MKNVSYNDKKRLKERQKDVKKYIHNSEENIERYKEQKRRTKRIYRKVKLDYFKQKDLNLETYRKNKIKKSKN